MSKNQRGLFYLIRSDFKRRAEIDGENRIYPYLFSLFLNQSLLGVVIYRCSHFCYQKKLYGLAKIGALLSQNLCCMSIDPRTEIGEKFCVAHSFGVYIFGSATIGNNVTVYQGVTITIGPRKDMRPDDRVIIEDNVSIYAMATIVGNIRIGKNSKIGANVFLKKTVPENSVVVAPDPIIIARDSHS